MQGMSFGWHVGGRDVDDGGERFAPGVWRAVLANTLAKSGEGIALCDRDLAILYATERAERLLQRLGMQGKHRLPPKVGAVVAEQISGGVSAPAARVVADRGRSVVAVSAQRLLPPGHAHAVIWLRAEVLHDEALFAMMRQRYNVGARGFQLVQLLRKGLRNREIARELRLTESTVKAYLHDLYRDCSVSSRTALIALVEELSRSS
jgi:DNA-binding CsgD family transcriptional regulator